MNEFRYPASSLIKEAFDKLDLRYYVDTPKDRDVFCVPVHVPGAPAIMLQFFVSEDRPVHLRIYGLLNDIPESRRPAFLALCNSINNYSRYLFYMLDEDGDLNAEYDFPPMMSEECVGKVAFEMYCKVSKSLAKNFRSLIETLYKDDDDLSDDDLETAVSRSICKEPDDDSTDSLAQPDDDAADQE